MMRSGHHLSESSGASGGAPLHRDSIHTGMGGTRREVDHLVKEIKENLKLGSAAAEHQLSPPPHPSLGGGKIKSGGAFKARSSFSHRVCAQRASPYHVPPSSRQCDSASGGAVGSGANGGSADGGAGAGGMAATLSMRRKQRWGRRRYPSTCMNNNKFVGPDVGGPDDPFAMLQELISDGSLIKEAVRRLQMDPADSADSAFPPAGRLTPGSGNNRASGRQTAYDSDSDNEDCRTPPEGDEDDVHVVQQETVGVATVGGGGANVSGSVVARSVTRTFPCCEVGL